MKVIVFGATGSVGRLAVERLLADGHEVTAFARRPEALEITNPKLKRLTGNVMIPRRGLQRGCRAGRRGCYVGCRVIPHECRAL